MFKANDPTAVAGQYTEGDPGVTAPTRIRADHLNAIQNELANAVEGFGDTLSSSDSAQLHALLQRQALKAALSGWKEVYDHGSGVLRAASKNGASGASGKRVLAVGDAGLILSSNGYDAFAVETPDNVEDFVDLVWDGTLSKWIIVGANGEIEIADGAGGAFSAQGGATSDFTAIDTDGSGHLIAVGIGDNIWTSSNGTAWANRTSAFPGSPDIVDVAWGSGRAVCVSDTGMAQFSTDNGVTWTLSATLGSALSSSANANIAWHSTLGFIFHHLTNVYRSTDGNTWTTLHNAVVTSNTQPGVLVAPYSWAIGSGGSAGMLAEVRTSPTSINASPFYKHDFMGPGAATTWRIAAGQLIGVRTTKIFMGGVL